MPWFITSIIGKETLEKQAKEYGVHKRYLSRKRTFGFYPTYNEAYTAVKENRGNIEECLYDYVVMEYIEPGIHPMVHSEQWWAWDTEKREWRFLPEDEKPREFMGICNWALG